MIELYRGDCLDVMEFLPSNSVDSIVTDPPYHFTSIVKRFGKTNLAADQSGTAIRARAGSDGYARSARGFMGKEWDGGDIAFRPETWAEMLRILKPGGHVAAFASSKGYHRMACAIEDAGFELRDTLMWLYGTGFPKSHNLDGQREGWGTALKPAFEPIVLARKPLVGTVAANVLAYDTGALNIDACRVPTDEAWATSGEVRGTELVNTLGAGLNNSGRSGAHALGRWPANILHDGSPEVLAAFPEAPGQLAKASSSSDSRKTQNVYGAMQRGSGGEEPRGDSGSAARFFYSAKAGKTDRAGSKHPTVKPVALMRWLCRLITPPGGTILDPFAGSGTTGQAAREEGFRALLIEREAEYQADICRRLGLSDPSAITADTNTQEGIFG